MDDQKCSQSEVTLENAENRKNQKRRLFQNDLKIRSLAQIHIAIKFCLRERARDCNANCEKIPQQRKVFRRFPEFSAKLWTQMRARLGRHHRPDHHRHPLACVFIRITAITSFYYATEP